MTAADVVVQQAVTLYKKLPAEEIASTFKY